MKHITTVIIGAGHSGLAMSRELSLRGVDHVVLERGQIANSWKTQRWDSLHLLTPNWMNGLPGMSYCGADKDAYMSVSRLVSEIHRFADYHQTPVQTETTVLAIDPLGDGYRVQTDQGAITCQSVVMANGACAQPAIPSFAVELPRYIRQLTPLSYKRPNDLPGGKALVVGASASGLQLAQEIQASGRQVTLAVGNHVRLPRRYRRADILHWLDTLGLSEIPFDQMDDIDRVRRTPSPGLVAEHQLDLNTLTEIGVEIAGRLEMIRDETALFSGSLENKCAAADLKMNRLLQTIDDWIASEGFEEFFPPSQRFAATRVPDRPRLQLNFAKERFESVIWATGFRPDFNWLNLPVFDRKARLQHHGGLVAQGLYVMGLPYLRQRKSTFIAGASEDAHALAAHLRCNLDQRLVA
ncbi:NAD(P)-binding domain-containing protein [Ruegeria hyattellae]|uniref:NAD(P)-binding domain-containing protein n=1 Tax=Ruegeria hyattellae TaxID=3233337 RepID=UPI00355B461E